MRSLKEIDNYPVPELLVPRLMKHGSFDEKTAKDLIKEAKRMLYIHAKSNENVSPSRIVDEAWHTMLLFTRFYYKFAKYIGKYTHHQPEPGPPSDGSQYSKTKDLYKEIIGEKPNPKYWP